MTMKVDGDRELSFCGRTLAVLTTRRLTRTTFRFVVGLGGANDDVLLGESYGCITEPKISQPKTLTLIYYY